MKNIKKFMSFFLVLLMMIVSLANTGFEVKATTNNQAVVYYYNANWSNANIHYKVGNGNWTSVPGVAMESSSEQSGYKWKYVIDLGSASSATVCFNDGNGNWDSRNASNYTVYRGSYGVKNETVTQLAEAEFKTTISADQTSVTPGTLINLLGKVYNENGHRYNSHYFKVINTDTNAEVASNLPASGLGNYEYSGVWTPTQAGNYKIFFYANEYSARTAYSSVNVTVKEAEFKTTISADKTSVTPGTTINLSGKVYNEKNHHYNSHYFKIKNVDTNTEVVSYLPASGSGNYEYSGAWTPTQAGNYEITFYANEYCGRLASSSVKVTVKDVTKNVAKIYYNNSSWSQANIHYQVGNGSWTAVPGVKMQASDDSRYTWMYTIDLGNASSANICFNNGNGSWDSRNSANYPVGKGTYVVVYGSVSKIAN